MPPEAMSFTEYQAAFAARLRDPRQARRPLGVPAKRMRVYEDLIYNNLEGFLLACYPVSRRILGARAWKQTVRRFFVEQRCHSPLFRDIPKAFLDWVEGQGAALFPGRPFLPELMHYEWLELSVSVTPEEPDPAAIEPDGDLLSGRPALNPTARLACYRYPVHRIGPGWQPAVAQEATHCCLLFQDDTDAVRFILLNPLSARLVTMLRDHPPSGREALANLAGQTAPDQYEHFVQAGSELLRDLHGQSALLGTWRES